jgi:hypothetical protein
MRRRISGYVPAEATPVTGQKTGKLWNCFFAAALQHLDPKCAMTADFFII